ncbi:Maf family nucleotide pyrophosphatase [Flavobacterium aciduliphilum]|uniref:dTTP/UTP pyrophosphatase n=1 Tax=Flavobacterium aciduliphilum TaxID=1101402 RepID=A0A328YH02_9FLAO|nr:Maf family nucleotide pyrophosphatase [Flavobacterium aciduliphilum]RAR72594.1 septum formation protein [Flavobacterium aciduliphilum]
MPNKIKIILASGSPRRQQFLKDLDLDAFFDLEIRVKEIEEHYPKDLKAAEITNYLALLKAQAFDNELAPNEVLITSDTIVWHKEQALGKPKDYEDAVRILQSLSEATHQVITSVCFKTNEKTALIHEVTEVTFSKLTPSQIHYYLDHYKPFDKAGAYGIQDWIGLIGISKIDGSYTNVVGLPTEKVYHYLTTHFIK